MEIKEEIDLKNIAIVQHFPIVFSNYIFCLPSDIFDAWNWTSFYSHT